ncbi:MAG: serine/threonine protein kinase, partial [Firmicutes bacterium]|nr:serine/threonine protein kinase [Bacillota bacterium]
MPSISVGRILDQRYRVLKPLGKGGMSTVFCVEDLQLGKRWAMKVLPLPEDPQSEPREVQILKCLDHPLAPRLVDRFVWQQQLCIIMDYIEGPTLQQLLDSNGPIDSDTAARWMQDVCSILSHLHENGILYRDVKPANLILSSSGHVKLVDFGYPTLLINGIEKKDPVPFGTRGYAAPEQRKGVCDRRSDVYGAGITLYQLLTAESPARKGFRLKPAMMLKPSIPPGMGRILRKATAQKPKDRFSSIDE